MKNKKYLHHELNDEPSLKTKILHSVREIVFGLEDGIVSTLGAITGIAVGTNSTFVVVLAGFVIIFVESLSMSAGTFLSSKSENEMKERMMREEAEEIENDPEKETRELMHFYRSRGFTAEETAILVKRIISDKALWLEEMAYKELGIIPGKEETPKWDALLMGISYIIGGAVPVSSYLFLPISTAIIVSIVASIIALFIVGVAKGKLVQVNILRSGIEMVVVSLSAAGVGYLVAQIVSKFFGVEGV